MRFSDPGLAEAVVRREAAPSTAGGADPQPAPPLAFPSVLGLREGPGSRSPQTGAGGVRAGSRALRPRSLGGCAKLRLQGWDTWEDQFCPGCAPLVLTPAVAGAHPLGSSSCWLAGARPLPGGCVIDWTAGIP